METWLHDWLSLLLRWAHFITGVAWIGASFYFNWLENHLERQAADDRIAGELWAVHGGGFYYLQKYRVAPDALPLKLHWFKYEAYFTWLTGLGLLAVVYYWNPPVYLLKSGPNVLNAWQAVTLSVVTLVASWLVYDGLCRSPLRERPLLLALCILGGSRCLPGGWRKCSAGARPTCTSAPRSATVMVANVAHVIIPAQRDCGVVRPPDAAGASAPLRRDNHLTLPVLFLMISSHYSGDLRPCAQLAHPAGLSIAAVGIRHCSTSGTCRARSAEAR
jgi:uncharacterized membrane protein